MTTTTAKSVSSRGTVLLMVIGVLALMAIIAIVYATIGRAEKSSSSTLLRAERVDNQTQKMAEYFVGVISESTLATHPEPAYDAAGAGGAVVDVQRRSAHTYPLVDDAAISVQGFANPPVPVPRPFVFDPSGTIKDPAGAARTAGVDLRQKGDPWLASFEPEFLDVEPRKAASRRPFNLLPAESGGQNPGLVVGSLTATGLLATARVPQNYPTRLLRDWAQISNFAPSGNFVNLANLRNNFAARSGFLRNPGDGVGTHAMSSRLSLYDRDGAVEAVAANFAPNAASTVLRANGTGARLNRPADWTINQLYSFRDVNDDSYAPEDPLRTSNQFADTDGDGYADARWFELNRLSVDPSNNNRVLSQPVLDLGSGRGGPTFRWFVAARAIDNSAMVNVNTATDLNNKPTLRYLPGITTADVDLRRLLTFRDFNQFWYSYGGTGQFRANVLDLAPYAVLNPATTGGYSDYRFTNTGGGQLNDRVLSIGLAGYASLRQAAEEGRSRPRTDSRPYFSLSSLPAAPAANLQRVLPLTAQQRASRGDELSDFANLTSASAMRTRFSAVGTGATATVDYNTKSTAQPFGLDDELELRTRNGINLSERTSRLEAVLDGRLDQSRSGTDNTVVRELGVMRSNRSDELERLGRNDPLDVTNINDALLKDGDRALLATIMDVRKYLTTVSGARPLVSDYATERPSVRASTDMTADLSAVRSGAMVDVDVDNSSANSPGQSLRTKRDDAVTAMFRAYADALMPAPARLPGAAATPTAQQQLLPWDNTVYAVGGAPDGLLRAGTLGYGGYTHELSMRMSAHMAVNLADMFDIDRAPYRGTESGTSPPNPFFGGSDIFERFKSTDRDLHVPTARSLMVSQAATTAPNANNGYVWPTLQFGDNETWRHAPAVPAALTGAAAEKVQRVNIFGVEPQPFLVEASALYVYVDSDATGTAPPPPGPPEVVLELKPEMNNDEFIGEIIAFQLHNPFSEPVCVYRTERTPNFEQARVQYYIEYAGLFYPLGTIADNNRPVINQSVYLEPGETRVFYATNPPEIENWADRLRSATADLVPRPVIETENVKRWLNRMFSHRSVAAVSPSRVRESRPVRVRVARDATTFEDVVTAGTGGVSTDLQLVMPSPPTAGSTGRTIPAATGGTAPGTTESGQRVVNLWRLMRSKEAGPGTPAADFEPTKSAIAQDVANNPENDLLADRLRDPTGTNGAGGIGKLEGLKSSLDGRGGETVENSDVNGADNTGLSVIMWAAVRRSADPVAAGSRLTTSAGALPAWCMEAKVDNDVQGAVPLPKGGRQSNGSPSFSFNTAVPANIETELFPLDENTFGGSSKFRNERFKSATDMLIPSQVRTIGAAPGPNIPNVETVAPNFQIAIPAEYKDGATAGAATSVPPLIRVVPPIQSDDTRHLTPRITLEAAAATAAIPARLATGLGNDGRSWIERAVDFYDVGLYHAPVIGTAYPAASEIRNPGLFSRAADFLLPLAIGAEQIPDLPDSALHPDAIAEYNETVPNNRIAQLESRWLTLSEAIAMSAGYYYPRQGATPGGAFSLYARAPLGGKNDYGTPVPALADLPRTDRGHLRLDAFTPAVVTGTNVQSIQPVGDGVPFALNVVSRMRAAPGVASIDPAVSDRITRDAGQVNTPVRLAAPGSASQSIPGVVNVNTAPRTTARLLPLASPTVSLASNIAEPNRTEWAAAGVSGVQFLGACCLNSNSTTPAIPPTCIVTTQEQCVRFAGATRFDQNAACATGRCSTNTNPNTAATGTANLLARGYPLVTFDDGVGVDRQLTEDLDKSKPLANPSTLDPLPTPEYGFGLYDPFAAVSGGNGILKLAAQAQTYDQATSIKAYRDKSVEVTRAAHIDLVALPNSRKAQVVDYADGLVPPGGFTLGIGGPGNPSRTFAMTAWSPWDPAWWQSGTPDPRRPIYREGKGILSVGELAMVNPALPIDRTTAVALADVSNGVQQFGREVTSGTTLKGTLLPSEITGWRGVVSSWEQRGTLTAGAWTHDVAYYPTPRRAAEVVVPVAGAAARVPSLAPYDHKLAGLNALARPASVRSDIFTVWYTVHGYLPEDVEVEDGQPMVPSVQKRFVMTVDRSNVVREGDRARVLMFKELPAE